MNTLSGWAQIMEEGRGVLAQARAEDEARELAYIQAERRVYQRAIEFVSRQWGVDSRVLIDLDADVEHSEDGAMVTLTGRAGGRFRFRVIGLAAPECIADDPDWEQAELKLCVIGNWGIFDEPTRRNFAKWLAVEEEKARQQHRPQHRPQPVGVEPWVCPVCRQVVGYMNVGSVASACSECETSSPFVEAARV